MSLLPLYRGSMKQIEKRQIVLCYLTVFTMAVDSSLQILAGRTFLPCFIVSYTPQILHNLLDYTLCVTCYQALVTCLWAIYGLTFVQNHQGGGIYHSLEFHYTKLQLKQVPCALMSSFTQVSFSSIAFVWLCFEA